MPNFTTILAIRVSTMTDPAAPPHPNFPSHGSEGVSRVTFGGGLSFESINAVIKCRLDDGVNGARHLTMDNRYQCPELAVVLRERFNVLSTGTTRSNRTGWDSKLMNLTIEDAVPKISCNGAIKEKNQVENQCN